MSFFDEDEDPPEPAPRTRAQPAAAAGRPRSGTGAAGGRGAGRPGGGSGGPGGRRPPGNRAAARPREVDPTIERRRLIAIAVLVILAILLILLISSCQASSTRNSLESYNNQVFQLINRSDSTGGQVFSILGSGKGGADEASALAGPLQAAERELADARNLGVPGQMTRAQTNVLLALRMRADGISQIATAISGLGTSASAQRFAVDQVALGTARFYASDVVYKVYAVPAIVGALHGDSIAVGGNSNLQVNGGQFLPNLGWLQTSYIATRLGAGGAAGGSGGHVNSTTPGNHGDALTQTAVGTNVLTAGGITNHVAASPAPTFTLSVQNLGNFPQYNLTCTVTVSGGPSGTAMLAQTTPGQTGTCNVTLPSAPTPGVYKVTASVSTVPLENDVANNTMTYTVQFS